MTATTTETATETAGTVHTTLVIGAGFAGLGTLIKLKEAGVDDVVVLERADRVGGTWRDATYPGVACDIPSVLYSYSFAANPDWTRAYPPGAEILRHVESLVERFDLASHLRFGVEVVGLAFDSAAAVWRVETAGGTTYLARTVVAASGPLADASPPAIRGLDTFEGDTILSARWDHDVDLAGKKVAVIGTGASAVQIIPELVRTVGSLKVFQRTPGWVLPRLDVEVPGVARSVFRHVPLAQRAARTALFWGHEAAATGLVWDTPVTTLVERAGRAHLRLAVKDPWLRRQLTPDFRAGCKRMLMSSDYYPALQADNCKLITWPIATMSPRGIRTSDGIEHDLDAVVLATGYDVHLGGPPYPVRGLGGRLLQDEWDGGAAAHKSIAAHGYPNLYFTTGPNSGPGHNSLLVYAEAQIHYAVTAIRTILDDDLRWLDVRREVQDAHNESIQRRLRRTTWMSGCSSWYLTADGHNSSMYPGFATQYRRQMSSFTLADHDVATRAAERLWNIPAAV